VSMRVRATLAIVAVVMLVASLCTQWVSAAEHTAQSDVRAKVALENARVRAYRTTTDGLAGVAHGPGVVVWLQERSQEPKDRALWLDDTAVKPAGAKSGEEIVIVQPLARAGSREAAPAASGSRPGQSPFVGMSFVPLFENASVSVLRARMDVNAREEFHTHASDTIVVHLSGGEIEDTADGRTTMNRWKTGDVEFESRGSSHSARNVGRAVDVVLVALKP
jgi:quercetin dioxygenase-like cupin family protein